MVSITPMSDAIFRKQIESIEFGFYCDKDVRSRSVCEITSSVSIDALGTPLPNGVYDPRLGPATSDSPPCATCALRYLGCPGHFGHIELCVPLYHPLLFGKLVEILRMKCLHCHKLTAPPRQLEVFRIKFQLLRRGRYSEALELDDRLSAVTKQSKPEGDGEKSQSSSMQSAILAVDKVLKELDDSMGEGDKIYKLSSYEETCHRELVKEVISNCKSSKSCPHCGAFSPRIRQDASNKIFQASMAASAARINEAEGIELLPALVRSGRDTPSGGSADEMDVDSTNDAGDSKEAGDSPVSRDKYMHPAEVKAQIERTWKTNSELCEELLAVQGPEIFFMQAVAVPPNRFRPPMHLGGMVVEHAQNMYLNKILTSNELVRANFVSKNEAVAYKHWIDLQTHLNCYMDSSKDPTMNQNMSPGIRQLLERKEGIFRKHMMGKRVNFACRSVISPDPYIGTNEIGIPRYFAETLTYPTPVTDINIEEMKRLVERGPNNWPGARWVEFPDRRVELGKMDEHKREAVASRLLMHAKKGGQPAIVGRQMRDGDMVLMNRQPTLHKPGIMAHEVRVLHSHTQKTIRMHYANCNTYNADFDGDEMNCHFPQSDLARAEAEYLARTDLQYIVPTDGSPLRGLIQDHVVAGVKLTKKDTFLEKWEYQQLLFAMLASLPRLEVIRSDANIELMPPAVLRPKALWTGKQVISTLLNHLRKGNDRDFRNDTLPGISTERKAKTPGSAFGAANEEHLVLIRDGELLRGILDKAAFGATDFSLVHAVFEAYGPSKAGLLLNALGRLFTAYIQYFSGHSCRMEDLVLTKASDAVRRGLIEKAYNVGSRAAKAWAASEGGKVPIELDESNDKGALKPVEAASASYKVRELLSGNEGKSNSATFDGFMMSKLNPLASDIVKACLPDGLAVPFPANTFGIMVTTGAKGSIVNQSQVTVALGQQALEGRRVPRMSSGRTLPSFAPYDVNPRADGFVMDRFLTGIRPQEYYFHCMAGREGLVDTAVKTSRSGYLQRCLVKHLEEVKVCYDYTVRNGEGGVLQFLYGEDGLDPTRASYLDCSEKSFVYMANNDKALERCQVALPGASIELAATDARRDMEVKNHRDPGTILKEGDYVLARRLRYGSKWTRGTLCEGWFGATIVKAASNGRAFDIKYQKDGHIENGVPREVTFERRAAESTLCQLIMPAAADPIIASSRPSHRLGSSGSCVSERIAHAAATTLKESKTLQKVLKSKNIPAKRFGSLVAAKYCAALCAPGEAVGSIAAQSVGEPSTQMTLNTFHLAGAGANVTLGIPRLREIIMTASRELKTPTMSVPLLDIVSDEDTTKLTRSFTKLTLNELIAGNEGVLVRETLIQSDSGLWERAYFVTLKFHPAERIQTAFALTLKDIAKVISKQFVSTLSSQMKLELRRSATDGEGVVSVEGGATSDYVDDEKPHPSKSKDPVDLIDDEDDDDDDNDSEAAPEDGAKANRNQAESYGTLADDAEEDPDANGGTDSDLNADDSDEDDVNTSNRPDTTATATEASAVGVANFGVKVDTKNNLIHLQPLRVDPSARPLLMVGLVEKAAARTLVRSRKNIDKAFVNHEEGRGRCLQTAGINFSEMWQLEQVDHNKLLSNDIWAIRCAYGVEAARNTIVGQIRGVFGVYGIEIDPRHLSLIADYMTFSGSYTAMNRTGMREMSSPFLQMSFETTAQFLTQAALLSTSDKLQSPSANIVVGRPIRHGTGAFSLLTK